MDERGVSPLIGFILIILLVVAFLGAVQSTIPDRCKKVEGEHIHQLEGQIADVKNIPSTITTHKIVMGADYPQYLFLMTPNTMSATLIIEDFNFTLEYKQILANGSRVERNKNITTSRITVSPNYLYYPRESLVLENTALFKRTAEDTYIALSDQTVFKNEVNLDLIEYPHASQGYQGSQGSPSRSFTGNDNFYLTVEPVSGGGSVLVEDLQITFESVNPRYWEGIPDYDVEVSDNKVALKKKGPTSLKYGYALIYGSSTSTEVDYSEYASQNWDLSTQTKLVQKIDHPLVLYSNETELLDVLLTVDGFDNPVGGFRIEGTATLGKITPRDRHTNSQGEASFLYSAPQVKHKSQKGELTFKCTNCTTQKIITYEVEVLWGKPGKQYRLGAGQED
ncbi:MAG: hypothetical protein R6U44_05260 [Archaeoglobaceae archaeon]